MRDSYACGTCGSTDLVVLRSPALPDRWELFCGGDHRIVPVPGEEFEVREFLYSAVIEGQGFRRVRMVTT